MTVAEVEEVTAAVVTVKAAVVLPAATFTVAGTVAEALLLDKATEIPPAGAAALRVTLPFTAVPPTTVVGVTETEDSAITGAGVSVSAAVLLMPW